MTMTGLVRRFEEELRFMYEHNEEDSFFVGQIMINNPRQFIQLFYIEDFWMIRMGSEGKKDKMIVDYVWRHAKAQNSDIAEFLEENCDSFARMLMHFIGRGQLERVQFFLDNGLPLKFSMQHFAHYIGNDDICNRSFLPVAAVTCNVMFRIIDFQEHYKEVVEKIIKSFEMYMAAIKEPFSTPQELRYYAENVLKEPYLTTSAPSYFAWKIQRNHGMVDKICEVYLMYYPQMAEKFPRPLMHLCRCSVREYNAEKMHRNLLSDINYPTFLKSYINLELEH